MEHANAWVTIFGFCLLVWVVVRPEATGTIEHTQDDPEGQPKQKETKAKLLPKPKAASNLVVCDIGTYGAKCKGTSIEIDGGGEYTVVVASIMNRPLDNGEPIEYAEHVQAELTFRLPGIEHSLTIHHAVWLGEDFNHTDIAPNAKRNLVIAVERDHDKEVFVVQDNREHLNRYGGLEYNSISDGTQTFSVEISLVENAKRIPAVFYYKLGLNPLHLLQEPEHIARILGPATCPACQSGNHEDPTETNCDCPCHGKGGR